MAVYYPNEFVGGAVGRHVPLGGGLVPGQPGFLDHMLDAADELGRELRGLYDEVRTSAVTPPALGVLAQIDHLEQGANAEHRALTGSDDPWIRARIDALGEDIDTLVAVFTRYNGAVPWSNAFFDHLARFDAMQALLGVRDVAPLAAALAEFAGRSDLERHGDGDLGGLVATATERAQDLLSDYLGFQHYALAVARSDQAAGARARPAAQRAHKAMAVVVDTPFAIVGARDAQLPAAPFEDTRAALADYTAAAAGDGDAARAAVASAGDVGLALDRFRDAAAAVRAHVVARRAVYRDLGRPLDAGTDGERAQTLAVALGQARECLAVGAGVRRAMPSASELRDTERALRERRAAPHPDGRVPAQALSEEEERAFAEVIARLDRYEASLAAVDRAFGEADRRAAETLGSY